MLLTDMMYIACLYMRSPMVAYHPCVCIPCMLWFVQGAGSTHINGHKIQNLCRPSQPATFAHLVEIGNHLRTCIPSGSLSRSAYRTTRTHYTDDYRQTNALHIDYQWYMLSITIKLDLREEVSRDEEYRIRRVKWPKRSGVVKSTESTDNE